MVHSLEHGYVLMLYRGIPEDQVNQLRQFTEQRNGSKLILAPYSACRRTGSPRPPGATWRSWTGSTWTSSRRSGERLHGSRGHQVAGAGAQRRLEISDSIDSALAHAVVCGERASVVALSVYVARDAVYDLPIRACPTPGRRRCWPGTLGHQGSPQPVPPVRHCRTEAKRADPQARVPWSRFDLINGFNAWKHSQAAGRVFVAASRQDHHRAGHRLGVEACGIGAGVRGGCRRPRSGTCRLPRRRPACARTAVSGSRRSSARGAVATASGSGTSEAGAVGPRSGLVRVPRCVVLPKLGAVRVHDDTRRLRRLLRPVGACRSRHRTVEGGGAAAPRSCSPRGNQPTWFPLIQFCQPQRPGSRFPLRPPPPTWPCRTSGTVRRGGSRTGRVRRGGSGRWDRKSVAITLPSRSNTA